MHPFGDRCDRPNWQLRSRIASDRASDRAVRQIARKSAPLSGKSDRKRGEKDREKKKIKIYPGSTLRNEQSFLRISGFARCLASCGCQNRFNEDGMLHSSAVWNRTRALPCLADVCATVSLGLAPVLRQVWHHCCCAQGRRGDDGMLLAVPGWGSWSSNLGEQEEGSLGMHGRNSVRVLP